MAATKNDLLPTIWEVPDALWERFAQPVLSESDPAPRTGRPRADQRRCLDGIIYRARTGCQWNRLPRQFGSSATVHRTLQRWECLGIFDRLWALLIYHCEELHAVHWEWQAADGMLNKARFIGDGQKGGIKRASQGLGRPKNKKPKASSAGASAARVTSAGSVPTRQTARRWASRPACLSRERAAHYLSASRRPT
jgi:transposase